MLIGMLAAAALAQAVPAATAQEPSTVLGSDAALAAVVARGQLLYLFDQAAWHSTDAMLKDVRDPTAAGVRGWIVEPNGKALRVTYFGISHGQPVPIYVSDFRNGKVSGARLVPAGERRALGPEQQRMIAARAPKGIDKLERCVPQPFNTVVLPAARPGAPLDVYYLTPQTKARAWPIGRHYRLRVGAGVLVETRAFSRTCLQIGLQSLPKGAKPVALFVNHIVDPTPNEIHVFTALASRIPLVVQTSAGRWMVDGRTISRIGDGVGPGR